MIPLLGTPLSEREDLWWRVSCCCPRVDVQPNADLGIPNTKGILRERWAGQRWLVVAL